MQASENEAEIKEETGILEEEGGDAVERVYELGYLLVPTLGEEDMPAQYGNIKELVSTLGGSHISDEMPKIITLAYPMAKVVNNIRNKFTNAYFGWTKFRMDSDKVLELKKKLDLDPKIIRFLILKTVEENTIASKRFIRPDSHRRAKDKGEGENATPINKEEIDKEIEALIS